MAPPGAPPHGPQPGSPDAPLAPTTAPGGVIVLVGDDLDSLAPTRMVLEAAGHRVEAVTKGPGAITALRSLVPDLVMTDVMGGAGSDFQLHRAIRADPMCQSIPLLFLAGRRASDEIALGLQLGADDFLVKPVDPETLLGRVAAMIGAEAVPTDGAPQDRPTVLVRMRQFQVAGAKAQRQEASLGTPACIAAVGFLELGALVERLGPAAIREALHGVMDAIQEQLGPLGVATRAAEGHLLLLFPGVRPAEARRRLERTMRSVVNHVYHAGRERVRLTPVVGFTTLTDAGSVDEAIARAETAREHSEMRLDLRAVPFTAGMLANGETAAKRRRSQRWDRWCRALRIPGQMALTGLLGLLLPYFVYQWLDSVGLDVTGAVYLVVVGALVLTSALIWTEGYLALERRDPPVEPSDPYPPASAIIAAYLPNEAATVIETVEAFLRLDYPAPIQIVLAYNTPHPLPVQDALRELARRHPNFLPLEVEGSTSKAQNVNVALGAVTGEFVGVFDADHHPQEDSYRRAWRWLASECDVVQGHCVIRNGDESWVARTVAVEFEAIYAVSHPGRARLHGFGIFGGTNGYWRTDLLRQTRMHGSMLTEDIDSSMRAVERGARIVSDPYLISRELGPATLAALWHQRLRWAQGWFQVSRNRFLPLMRSRKLRMRQKAGLVHLLLWREVFPWIALQIFPIIAFWMVEGRHVDWKVPLFLLTTLFTLATGPLQCYFIARLAAPDVQRHRWWIVRYMFLTLAFYGEFKNLIARLAQMKELAGERAWKVTPRGGAGGGAPSGATSAFESPRRASTG